MNFLVREVLLQIIKTGVMKWSSVFLWATDGENRPFRCVFSSECPLITRALFQRRPSFLESFEAQLRDWDEHGLNEGEGPVNVDVAFLAERALDFLLDHLWRVEQVDLAVRVGRGHLPASGEAGHHLVHEVRAFGVANPGEERLGVDEDFALEGKALVSGDA